MKNFIDSLYGRLAIVLIISLLAGFGTMYAVFHSHSDENRRSNLARTVSVQIQLVEEILRAHPNFDKNPSVGIVLSESPISGETASAAQKEFLDHLKSGLKEELGRDVTIQAGDSLSGGFWVDLNNVPQGPRWLFFSSPRPRRGTPRLEPWRWGLWTSFFVVLTGGMAMLWGVNKPLKTLENAIGQVGRVDYPAVEISGPREIRNLAGQFNEMVKRLQQYDQDRAEMLAGVAHDLRAPITRLRLQLELEESARREAMIGNLDGIDAIVNQFLSFAQGIAPETAERCSLRQLIEATVAPYLDQGITICAENNAAIELELMPTLLRRALSNLLENALVYGGAPITIGYMQHGDHAVIQIVDHGPGIPPDKVDTVVQAFTRLDAARPGKGHCGLGLAIAARIAKMHGGCLMLRQGTPNGLVAEIHLPIFTSRA